jgi:hypothetical protein
MVSSVVSIGFLLLRRYEFVPSAAIVTASKRKFQAPAARQTSTNVAELRMDSPEDPPPLASLRSPPWKRPYTLNVETFRLPVSFCVLSPRSPVSFISGTGCLTGHGTENYF